MSFRTIEIHIYKFMSVIKGSETSIVLNPKSIITSSFFLGNTNTTAASVFRNIVNFFIKNELMNTVCL